MRRVPLSPPYRWRIDADLAFLDFNAGNVATVRRDGDRYRIRIRFRQHTHEGTCGSIAQGVYFIERWLAARGPGALPGGGKVHWYDLLRPDPRNLQSLYQPLRPRSKDRARK